MVTFNNAGRLGNWCFEAATTIGYAVKHGLEFSFPNYARHPYHSPVYLTEYFNNYDRNLQEVHLWEGVHCYEELPFEESWRNMNIVIEGYRQTERYFNHCSELVKNIIHPDWVLNDAIGIHVRRGDYLVLTEKHPPVTKEWYEYAMQQFPDCRFVFFSDDIKWCVENFCNRKDCLFSIGNDELTDLRLLANCRHQINSSSTFSWWGAWLGRNEDKIVYTPELWFTLNWGNLDISDIIPDKWIKL